MNVVKYFERYSIISFIFFFFVFPFLFFGIFLSERSRFAFFIGGSVCDVRANLGLLVLLRVLFGLINQRF